MRCNQIIKQHRQSRSLDEFKSFVAIILRRMKCSVQRGICFFGLTYVYRYVCTHIHTQASTHARTHTHTCTAKEKKPKKPRVAATHYIRNQKNFFQQIWALYYYVINLGFTLILLRDQLDNSFITNCLQLDNSFITKCLQLDNSFRSKCLQLGNSFIKKCL
jgi:hypothetical protein